MNFLLLNGADLSRLRLLLDPASVPRLNHEQRSAIEEILSRSRPPDDGEALESRVGFEDRVTLVSPLDSGDFFNFEIVMPDQANLDAERIPVLMPICLATLGRRCGEKVSWETHAGRREMRIIAIVKAAVAAG